MKIEQRTPVPALGDGWFLLGHNETIQKGDMFDATCLDGGWVDACTCIGRTLEAYPIRCRAARYFGPAKEQQRIQREYWINVYPGGSIREHGTREKADRDASNNRIACIKITIVCEEGEGL